ncbi:MAG: histidine phosphatase family protein [Saprospiraceae bacterium]|nr:histidine phosphatase family protein [Saprospiraceae bacterium]
MKKLYLVRHAKSSWDDYTLPDEKRPLNSRGKRDAPVMAGVLTRKAPELAWLVSSPAKRAYTTAKVFAKDLGLTKEKLNRDARLYHASAHQIMHVIKETDDTIDEVAVFGHNPGMTDFLNRYTDGYVDNIPTCGLAIIHFDVEKWSGSDSKPGKLVEFLYPKMLGLF